MGKFWPDVMNVLRDINTIQPIGGQTPEQKVYLATARRGIIDRVRDNGNDVNKSLGVYDASFLDLVEHQSPRHFRDFLLSAPYMFLELGEKLGAISHIVSFWRYRFAPGSAQIDSEELAAIFQDFASGFGEKLKGESSLIKKPVVIDMTAA
jgi:hypothetical protein